MMLAMGLILSTVGLDPVEGAERFTFGLVRLTDGLQFVVVAMGLFGLSEVLLNLESPEVRDIFKTPLKKMLPTLADWRKAGPAVLRGSVVGFLVGILPGGGAVISSFLSYAIEKRASKEPQRFGKGAIEGVASPESANNAAATSSFIPLLTLGVPGNNATAMIFIALLMHGVRPGPLLLQEHPQLFWGVIASMYVGNIMLLGLNLPLISLWVRMLKVPYKYLALVVVTTCLIGAYSVANSIFDVGMMIFFGLVGYLLRKADFPAAPLILALILCPRLERSLQQSLIGSAGDPTVFFQSPISAGLLFTALLMILIPAIRRLGRRGGREQESH